MCARQNGGGGATTCVPVLVPPNALAKMIDNRIYFRISAPKRKLFITDSIIMWLAVNGCLFEG